MGLACSRLSNSARAGARLQQPTVTVDSANAPHAPAPLLLPAQTVAMLERRAEKLQQLLQLVSPAGASSLTSFGHLTPGIAAPGAVPAGTRGYSPELLSAVHAAMEDALRPPAHKLPASTADATRRSGVSNASGCCGAHLAACQGPACMRCFFERCLLAWEQQRAQQGVGPAPTAALAAPAQLPGMQSSLPPRLSQPAWQRISETQLAPLSPS